jgi:oxygen-independent coproporphyrinogen-3 oxidase
MTSPPTTAVNRSWFPEPSPVLATEDLATQERIRQHLHHGLASHELPSYVYTYPPRQTYRNIIDLHNREWTFSHLVDTPGNFSLYFHFPFCKQICSYCNLFAVGHSDESILDDYIAALGTELEYYRPVFQGVRPRTVFLGGGTPSLLSPKQLERLFAKVDEYLPDFRSTCEEICLEAAPDTVTRSHFSAFKDLGINRVNLGIQSLADDELTNIGRLHSNRVCRDAIDALQLLQFDNLVLDLINGLLDQSRASWLASVREVAALHPETTCTYFLKVRPATGVFNHRGGLCDTEELYYRYEEAREILKAGGYEQETNIRYRIPGRGGYKQKVYHWSGATILGLGAGARTYTPRLHFRNGYSAKARTATLRRYLANIREVGHSREDGFLFSPDEEIRRFFVLNIHDANKNTFSVRHGLPFDQCFQNIRRVLIDEAMLIDDSDSVHLTPLGFKYRDLICWLFFSEEVAELEASYSYD